MKKNAAGKQKETGIRTQKQAYLFLAPSLIILTVFVFVPLVGAIAISLMNINIYMNDISFAGLKNYLKMFTDARVGNATLNTFYFALQMCIRDRCVPCGTPHPKKVELL